MFIVLADQLLTPQDIENAKRRERFAKALLKRTIPELQILINREYTALDLELAGCETATDYTEIIAIILSHKAVEAIGKKPADIFHMQPSAEELDKRIKTALNILYSLSAYLQKDLKVEVSRLRETTKDLIAILDGKR